MKTKNFPSYFSKKGHDHIKCTQKNALSTSLDRLIFTQKKKTRANDNNNPICLRLNATTTNNNFERKKSSNHNKSDALSMITFSF